MSFKISMLLATQNAIQLRMLLNIMKDMMGVLLLGKHILFPVLQLFVVKNLHVEIL